MSANLRTHSSIGAEIGCEVAFHDVDLAQVVWHGHYLRYLENARWALMRELDFDLPRMLESGFLWPIVDLRVKYIRAAVYGDRLRVRASLVESTPRLVINYLVSGADGGRVARAQTAQVAVRAADKELQLETPRCFLERVESYGRRHAGAGEARA